MTAIFHAPTNSTDDEQTVALASIDISTGEFIISQIPASNLLGEIVRLQPSEILIPDQQEKEINLAAQAEQIKTAITPVPSAHFDSISGGRMLKESLNVLQLDGFGSFSRPELSAIGAVLRYIELTQIGKKPALRAPKRQNANTFLAIDAATRINLELTKSIRGERKGSLLATIDRTLTGPGKREIAARLSSPLMDTKQIAKRLDTVDFLLQESSLRAKIRKLLQSAPDIARSLSRLALSRGGPRDLGAIKDGLNVAKKLT